MRQDEAVNGSKMVVKTGVIYYRRVKGIDREVNWDLQLHPQIHLIDQLLSTLKNRLVVMINNVVLNDMMLDKSAMLVERNC